MIRISDAVVSKYMRQHSVKKCHKKDGRESLKIYLFELKLKKKEKMICCIDVVLPVVSKCYKFQLFFLYLVKIDGKSKSSTTMMKEMAEAQCRVYKKEGVWVGCVWGIQSMIQRIAIKVYLSIFHKIKLVCVS